MKKIYTLSPVIVLLAFTTFADAAISLNATRMIINSDKAGGSITVRNDGDDVLIQSWVEDKSGGATENQYLPLAVTPTIVRLSKDGQQLIRVIYQGEGLPKDRESLFWLNIQEIPRKTQLTNAVQFAIRQRIKIFYRPETLIKEDSNQSALKTKWNIDSTGVSMYNPTPFYINMVDINQRSIKIKDFVTLPPFGKFIIKSTSKADEIKFKVVNDFGGYDNYSVSLLDGKPIKI